VEDAVRRRTTLLARVALGGALVAAAFFLVNSALADPPPTFVVTTTADSDGGGQCTAVCSLRDAINAANAAGGATIDFNIGSGGVQTITLATPLPDITSPVTVDGTSQPDTSGNAFGVAIDGAGVTSGLVLGAGSGGSTIRGLALGNFAAESVTEAAIEVDTDGNTIAGNSLGVRADGTTALTNDNGIFVTGDDNTIGGATPADRNIVVNGLGVGILVQGNGDSILPTKNAVLGNYVGVLGNGTTVAGNRDEAIQVIGAQDTVIGGPVPADGNVLAVGTGNDAIWLGDPGNTNGSNTTVRHNLINLTADGSASLGPVSGNGIDVEDHGSNTIVENTIADTYQGIDICNSPNNLVARNVIGSNTANGSGPDFGVHNEGIAIENGGCQEAGSATGNTIGGQPGAGNVVTHSQLHDIAIDGDQNEISYNTVRGTKAGPGIQIGASNNLVAFNTITGAQTAGGLLGSGVQVDPVSSGPDDTGNTISENSIHGNAFLGIDLGRDGVTPNDAGDGDNGANDLQNFPLLSQAGTSFGNGGKDLTVGGTLDAVPDQISPYAVEIFQSTNGDQSGNGEGAKFVGTILVNVTSGGGTEFGMTFPTVSSGTFITATATAPDGSTSEFSPWVTASGSAPPTFIVNTTEDTDDGSCTDDVCSLRDAINAANASGGTIEFDVPGAAVAPTISLDTLLPAITSPVTIDGTTQSGTPANTPGVMLVDGGAHGGLDLALGSDGSTVHGLAFGGFGVSFPGTAIRVESDHDVITGNWIGVAPDSSLLGSGNVGIHVSGNSDVIGGGAADEPNTIEGTDEGIVVGNVGGGIPAVGNTVQGNLLEGNANGIYLGGAVDTVVGNDDDPSQLADVQAHPELGNVIAGTGSSSTGIDMLDGTTGTIAAGNFIGVDRAGHATVRAGDGFDIAAPTNQIGPGNVIAHSTHDGVFVFNDTAHEIGISDRIVANSIFDSGNLGIELVQQGNNLEPAPVVTAVTGGTITGTVSSNSGHSVFLEAFVNPSCSGQYANGAGVTYAGTITTAPGTFAIPVAGLTDDEGVTVTATDVSTGDTSEFSNCAVVSPTTIAFESNRNGSSEIFAMDADGSNVTQLTHDPATVIDTAPSISPDGQTIVYQSTVGGVTQIWAMSGGGSNQHQLTSLGSNRQPAFSHDGTKIAFDSNRDGNSRIYLMNPDGTGQTPLTASGNASGASWSSDNTEIVYDSDAGGGQQIYIVDVATGIVTPPLTTTGTNTNPHWSPGGSQILFVSDQCAPTCGGGESVYVMNADGTNQQNLTNAPIFDADPAWSPDGSHIAFVRDLGGQNFNVFRANANGTNQIQLTFGTAPQRNSFPDWGAQVSAPPDSTAPTAKLTAPVDGAGLSGLVWLGGNVVDPGTSPSGVATWSFQTSGVDGRFPDPTSLSYSDIGTPGTGSGDVSTSWATQGSGAFYIRLKVTDNVGNVGFSTPVFVQVDNANPNRVFQVDSSSIGSLDPLTSIERQILYATCAKLYNAPDTGGQASLENLQPELATGPPVVSADRKTWTFQIASGRKFSDGTPITAQDLARTSTRATDPANLTSTEAGLIFSDVVSAVANGSTLTITLSKPDEALPAKLATSAGCAIPASTPAAPQTTALPGSGPYYVASYVPGKQLILDRNPFYTGSRPSFFDQFVYTLGVSPAQAETDVANDDADYAAGGPGSLPKTDLSDLSGSFPGRFFRMPTLGLRYVVYNTQRSAFSSATVRHNVSGVLDRSQYAGDLSQPSSATDQLLPTGMPGYLDRNIYSSQVTDDTAVAAFLHNAGVTPSTINLYAITGSAMDQLVNHVAARFTHLGFTVNVVREPSSQFFGSGPGGILNPNTPFDLALTGWIPDYPDPNDSLNALLEPSRGNDWPGFNDPTALSDLSSADATPLGSSRFTAYQNLDLELSRDYAPMTAYGTIDSVDFFSSRVGCETYNPFFGMDLAALCTGAATGASASFSSGGSVQMSGSVRISDIPLAAFDPQPPGAPPISTHGLQLNQTQLNQTQLNQTQLNQTQLNQTQLNQTQLNQTQLNQTPLDPTRFPDGWAGLLQGTTLAGQPLQTITLHDVMALKSPPNPQDVINRIQSLTFADLQIQSTSLAQLTVGALVLGSAEVNQLGNLTDTIESQLHDWCLSFAPPTDPHHFCSGDSGLTGSGPGIGYLTTIQLSLLGAPVQSLQLNQTQLNQTQLNQTPLGTQLNQTQLNQTPAGNLVGSASGIVGMQVSGLDLTSGTGIAGLSVGSLPTAFFDCSNPTNFDCSSGTLAQAQAAGAIRPTTTVGDLDVGDFFKGVTIGQLLESVLGPRSIYKDSFDFGDVVGLYLRSSDVKWETLTPDLLSIFDPARNGLAMSAGFTIQGAGALSADVNVDVPAGFDFVPGSATLAENGGPPSPLGDPTITRTASGYELEWPLASVDAGAPYALYFQVFSGTAVGPAQATETVSAGGFSDSSIAAFSVLDSFPGDDTAGTATPIDTTAGHNTVDMSTLPTPGAVDYYTFPMPPAGTRIQVHLTNLPADYDLALYAPRSTSVRTTTNVAPPLQDGIVSDPQVNLNGGSSGQLTPTGLADLPDPGIPLVQLSDNRHADDEDVGMVSPGGVGSVTIAVFGYNGAFNPRAYTLRVRETTPAATPTCAARSFPHAGGGTTPDSVPALSSLPANLNTIILVDEKRLGDTYGVTDEANAVAKLHHLAGDGPLGVSGVVVPVEAIPGVQALYNTWDSNPCDPNAANAVANAIANEVNAIVAARPTARYLVFGGGDDQIPFFRLPDLSLIANESGFAGQFGPNEYQGPLAAGDLLSDDPYLNTQPVPATGRQLFPPDLAGGRLVETAQDIANAVTAFETAPTPGALKSSTAFVSGYDFVADGSQRVANNLGSTTRRLIADPLSRTTPLFGVSDFLAAAFPTGGPADVNSWNGHYDNTRTQLANGDVLSTSGLPGGLNGGVFFTMGCHAGFQTTDAVVGSTVLDWPQYFAQHNTGFVGNTGYGLGDTDSVAFSEELMSNFAGNLGGSTTLGQALLQAKRQYYLSRVAFSNYDEKTLSEAELYGLPMYSVGSAPAPLFAATRISQSVTQGSTPLQTPSDPSPDPVHGAAGSTSPSQGPLSSFPGTGVQSAGFAATPHFVGPVTGQDGQYFTNDGQLQAPNYRPLQPYVSLPAARSGLVAHGVVIDNLTSHDNSPFAPDNVRPILNSSAAEPPPSFTDEAWPEKIPTLVSLGRDQSLNLITGQFFTATSGGTTTGVERLWTQIGGRVTYSTSLDFTPPTIESINAFETDPGQSGDVLGFTGRFSDLDEHNQPGTVVFAQVIYDDGTGNWQAVQLQRDQASGLWSAGVPFSGSSIQYFVEACDGAGNCGYSSNKGNYFDAQPLPSGTGSGGSAGTLTISPSRDADSGSWYTGTLTVTAATTAPDAGVTVSVDGGPFHTADGPVTLSGDGAHVVVARDSADNTATGVYLIDTTAPAIAHTVSPAVPDGTSGWYKTQPTVTFSCPDNLSGTASCLADGTLTAHKTVGDSASSQSVGGTARDNVGNTSHDSATVTKVDSTAPATPVFHAINAQSYPQASLPSQAGIFCTSSDQTSGLSGCVVTGYGTSLGPHQLLATATDRAGNTSTSTLTYTVVAAPTFTSANSTIFTSGMTNTFPIATSASYPAPAITNANFTNCIKSTLPSNVTLHDNGTGTATLSSTAAAMTPGNYTLCLTAANNVGTATQKFTLAVFKAPTFAGITFVNTVQSGGGKVPNCTTNNPFGTKTNDVNAFPNPICSSDGNAPNPSTFSWQVELASGTPQKPTPVVNTGGPITVSVLRVATTPNGKKPLPTFLGPQSATIANASAATTVPFKVGSIGNGNWIQVTVAVTVGGNTSTFEMQVH
jgi:CSLREA domain-containing protein